MHTPEVQLFSLEALRSKHTKILVFAQWAHVPLIAVLGLYMDAANLIQALALSAAIAMGGSVSFATSGASLATRCVVAVGFCMQAATLTFLASGHPWQIDMHMYFFAALAMSVAMFDVRATFAAAGATALHHLILNFVAPVLVFPSGADLARVILHAVIVIAETGMLLYLISQFNKVMTDAETKTNEVVKARETIMVDAEIHATAMERLDNALAALASGDLTIRLQDNFPDRYSRVRDDFNSSVEKQEHVLSEIIYLADGISDSAGEISQAADSLARRSETQAANIEQTSAMLNDVTETVTTTAETSRTADTTTSATRSRVESSSEVMSGAIAAMGDIEKSSDQISQIVSVIDEIAFQTNLLALNAGVEAARAGDAGRGFAVVATEVRELAGRSSRAAKEIGEIISQSHTLIEQGVELVRQTGGELEQIQSDVGEIAVATAEITSATNEQATSIAEINGTLSQVSKVTQQNAAMVEESTAASHALSRDARKLRELISHFRTSPRQSAEYDTPLHKLSA